ncbi:MAG: hypothetical protein HDR75_01895 [Bacteroides sp.]|nr:hypothetical protein [Bacteroides sp.]
MDKLKDAYDFINHYRKRNKPIPEDVIQEACDAEVEWLRLELASAFQEHIQPILDKIESSLTLICEHTPNEPAEIFITREPDIVALLDDATSLSSSIEERGVTNINDDPRDIDDEEIIDDETTTGRSKSIGFTVRFDDGFVVSRSSAKDTMIEVFRRIGFEKVALFKGRTFKGYSLVDRRKRSDSNGVWQENVGNGWYVYVNMSNDTKKIMIQRVAAALNVKLSIFDNIEYGISTILPDKARKPRAVFSFNGRSPQDKRNSVLAVVKAYVQSHPHTTYKELLRSFPDKLQGSYGVIRSLDEIDERRNRGQQVDNRYFLDPHDILTSSDGIQYAVSNQWGDQFYQFQQHVKSFGWTLVEV